MDPITAPTPRTPRPRGLTIVAVTMVVFGIAEVVTGFTHRFFGVATTETAASTYAGAAIGALYIVAGLLVLRMQKRSAAFALIALALDVAGRVAMAVTGLYPTGSARQRFAIVLGTAIVVAFAGYIGSQWRRFR